MPAAVVTSIALRSSPVRVMTPPIPALVAWIKRSRGQRSAVVSGIVQSKSNITSAPAVIAPARALAGAQAAAARPSWSHV